MTWKVSHICKRIWIKLPARCIQCKWEKLKMLCGIKTVQQYFAGISERNHKSSQVCSYFFFFYWVELRASRDVKYGRRRTRSLLFIRRPLESGGPARIGLDKTRMTMFTKIVNNTAVDRKKMGYYWWKNQWSTQDELNSCWQRNPNVNNMWYSWWTELIWSM